VLSPFITPAHLHHLAYMQCGPCEGKRQGWRDPGSRSLADVLLVSLTAAAPAPKRALHKAPTGAPLAISPTKAGPDQDGSRSATARFRQAQRCCSALTALAPDPGTCQLALNRHYGFIREGVGWVTGGQAVAAATQTTRLRSSDGMRPTRALHDGRAYASRRLLRLGLRPLPWMMATLWGLSRPQP
jgi:hypothetical protein